LTASAERTRTIWRFSDGRAGHDSQSSGLILALKDRTNCESYEVNVPLPFSSYCWSLMKKLPCVSHLPDPDLLIGAGHACHLPMLVSRCVRGGQTLVLMRPSLPTRLFDLCLIPAHDQVKQKLNVIPTEGPLNTLHPSGNLSSSDGLILIGGTSKHFNWDEKKLAEQLLQILDSKDIDWTITDSPRTPVSTRNLLQSLHKGKVTYVPFSGNTVPALAELLQKSGIIWVSEDSMSMIYEALSTGASIGILRVQQKGRSKLANVAPSLANRQLLTLYEDWVSGKALAPPAMILSESSRCADAVIDRLNWRRIKAT
jgi:mitochondrial fission protein ELM1